MLFSVLVIHSVFWWRCHILYFGVGAASCILVVLNFGSMMYFGAGDACWCNMLYFRDTVFGADDIFCILVLMLHTVFWCWCHILHFGVGDACCILVILYFGAGTECCILVLMLHAAFW
jgi:hypothetical protein